jgi:hypothetical protein
LRTLFKRYCDLMQEYRQEYQAYNFEKALTLWDEIEEIGKKIVERSEQNGPDPDFANKWNVV